MWHQRGNRATIIRLLCSPPAGDFSDNLHGIAGDLVTCNSCTVLPPFFPLALNDRMIPIFMRASYVALFNFQTLINLPSSNVSGCCFLHCASRRACLLRYQWKGMCHHQSVSTWAHMLHPCCESVADARKRCLLRMIRSELAIEACWGCGEAFLHGSCGYRHEASQATTN